MVKDLKDVFKKFNTEKKCIAFLVKQRWAGVPTCPYCNGTKSYVIEGGKRFKCGNSECYKKYSVTIGTVMHASNIPLTIWLPAMYIVSAHKKGISSIQLAKDLGVTQKTSWFMIHRVRESLKEKNSPLLSGIVEVDETYLAKKFRSDFQGLTDEQIDEINSNPFKKMQKGRGAVLGMAQRGGKVVTRVFNEIEATTARQEIKNTVEAGSKLFTDKSGLYRTELDEYVRGTVKHTGHKPQWVDGEIHINTIENFWGVMKRAIYGTWHQVSYKHLQRYCDECSYRYNTRATKDGERFMQVLTQINGKLPYKQLVNGKDSENSQDKNSEA